jgi:hypothetical protein
MVDQSSTVAAIEAVYISAAAQLHDASGSCAYALGRFRIIDDGAAILEDLATPSIIERINARGALVKVLDKPHLDLTTPLGRGFLAFLSAMAEDERQRIVKRANAGRTAARERGARFGRRPTLSAEQQADARRRLAGGESARSLGRIYRVSHTTIARLGASA